MIALAYQFVWRVVIDRWPQFVAGAWVDLWVAVVGFALACAIGLLNALLRTSGMRALTIPSFLYVQVMRGVPLYVMLVWIYFGVANITGINFTSFEAIIITLALTGSGYTTEIFRAGLGAIDSGQMEAARSIGLSRARTYGHVVLPQALRIVVPPLGNTFVGLLKGATIMAVIAVIKGLYHWAQVTGFIGGEDDAFENQAMAWQAATVYFAVIELVAAVGLWLATPLGAVVWLTTVVSMAVIELMFPAIYGGSLIVVVLETLMLGAYLALAWMAARERPP